MADSKNSTHEEEIKSGPISVAVDEELSDEDLDKAIEEEDPDFLKSVNAIGDDKNLTLPEIELTEDDLNEEKEAWEHSNRLTRTLYHLLPFLPRLSLFLKKTKYRLSSFVRAQLVRLKNFLYFLATEGKSKAIAKVKKRVHAITDGISDAQRNFRYLGWKQKLAVLGIGALFIGTAFFIYRSATKGVIPAKDELFMPTMERVASEVIEYNPETETEPFYENLRSPTNILLIPKMVVNLKKSTQSGPNPMGAFEFFVEGMVPEVVIEIKDREIEIRDLMQRVVEGFTFDQVDSPEGKAAVCEKLKKEVNLILTTGKIKRVWLKTVIVKP